MGISVFGIDLQDLSVLFHGLVLFADLEQRIPQIEVRISVVRFDS